MKKTIKDFELKEKKVLIRCDFNVPVKNGKIQDDTRIKESLPTIEYALSQGAKVILFSHLGRVKSEEEKQKNNLEVVKTRLSELLKIDVKFSNQTRGDELETMVESLKKGEVLLVQNTRYEDLENKKESNNDPQLGKYWASLGEIFINDAFGTIHRSHASNVGISTHIDSGIGFLIEKELKELEILKNPKRPFVVILGGSKVADKIGVIENLIKKCDKMIIGGGMAFTFLKSQGINVGKSIIDTENIDFCQQILKEYKDKIILPVDIQVTEEFNNESPNRITKIEGIKENEMGMDLGTETLKLIKEELKNSQTIFWNGPLGVYEMEKYKVATQEILETLTRKEKCVILGGGDIVAAATSLGLKEKVTHASTGGGATLEYLEGKSLPGLECISEK